MLGERWGVSDEEVARRYPCDDIVPAPVLQLWRGITVNATPAEVWRWVCQVRLAPYSYDWLDNLGRRSPQELRGLPDPQSGDSFTCVGARFDVGRVLFVAHEEHITGRIWNAVMSYVLVPCGPQTRLLLKICQERDSRFAPVLAVGDWPMARRQLKNFKSLAESAVE